MSEIDPDEEIEVHLRRFGLRIAASDAPVVREVLQEQVTQEANRQGDGNTELMRLCCVQLFGLAQSEDVLRIWQAKKSSFDASFSIDVQLLCGTGLEETVRFFHDSPQPLAKDALDYVVSCRDAGDFADFSPEAYLQGEEGYYRDYLAEDRDA